jgi:hypothetical protein
MHCFVVLRSFRSCRAPQKLNEMQCYYLFKSHVGEDLDISSQDLPGHILKTLASPEERTRLLETLWDMHLNERLFLLRAQTLVLAHKTADPDAGDDDITRVGDSLMEGDTGPLNFFKKLHTTWNSTSSASDLKERLDRIIMPRTPSRPNGPR